MRPLIACLSLGAIGLMPLFIGAAVTEPQQTPPVPVVIAPTDAAYKVIDITRISVGSGQTPASTLENVLNDFAAQGWKLSSVSNSFIILSR